MAQRLCDAGHYAQNAIRIQAAKLEREWKSLAAALDDRSTVLSMSVMFHKKAETVSFPSDIMVWYNKLGMFHCFYQGVEGYNFIRL